MNDYPNLNGLGRRLLCAAGDVKARLMLIDLAESAYTSGALDASASLMHAEYYLKDRLAYELYPAPKGCIWVESAIAKGEK